MNNRADQDQVVPTLFSENLNGEIPREVVARAKQRLGELRQRMDACPSRPRPRLLLRWPVAFSCVASVAVVCLIAVALWLALGVGQTSLAFADVVEKVRQIRPYECTFTIRTEGRLTLSKQLMLRSLTKRREVWSNGRILVFDHSQKPVRILILDPARKTATEQTLADMGPAVDFDLLGTINKIKNGTAEDLGIKEIDGRKAHGFRAVLRECNDFTIWADPKTGLPIRVELRQPEGRTIVMSHFDFNVSFDESLFSTTAPAGYSVKKEVVKKEVRKSGAVKFRPYTCTITTRDKGQPESSMQVMQHSLTQRREVRSDGQTLVFDLSRKPLRILVLEPANKTATELTLANAGPAMDFDLLGTINTIQNGTEKDLGVKEIEGRKAHGFRAALDEQNDFTVWTDLTTGLPIHVEIRQPTAARTLVMSRFDFDAKHDESLFSTTAPAGYTVKREERKEVTPAERR